MKRTSRRRSRPKPKVLILSDANASVVALAAAMALAKLDFKERAALLEQAARSICIMRGDRI